MTEKIATEFSNIYEPFNVRQDLIDAHEEVWANLGRPGTWLTAAEKVAIAAETRAAQDCTLCRKRKEALSPYAVEGVHDSISELDPARIDAIHRIVTDPGRLSRRLITDLADQGITDVEYVELLGVIMMTMDIDMFHRAVGIPPLPLPKPQPGEPTRQRPTQLSDIGAWLPVLSTRDPLAKELFNNAIRVSNVALGLSLVPEMTRDQVTLIESQYVPLSQIASTVSSGRAITRAQMELIASRVSALNECFY